MRILIGFAILLSLASRASGQEPSISGINSSSNQMENDRRDIVVSWAGATVGLKLSNDEKIVTSTDEVIIIESKGHPDRMMAMYSFNPQQLPEGTRLEITHLRILLLQNSRSATRQEFREIPDWIGSLHQLENLTLLDADLTNIAICQNLPLKVINLRRVNCRDIDMVLRVLENLQTLEILVHDNSLPEKVVSSLKEKLPKVKLLAK